MHSSSVERMKTTFSVQASLPVNQHVRIVGNTRELGKWSPFDSVKLHKQSSCSWTVDIPVTAEAVISFRYLICEHLEANDRDVFAIKKVGPLKENNVTSIVNDCTLDIDEATWVDGWLLYETEIHLEIHNASGFPFCLLQHCKSVDPDALRIKVSKIDLNKAYLPGESSCDLVTKVIGEYYSSVCEQDEMGVCYDSSKQFSFVSQVLDLNDTMFKIEVFTRNKNNDKYNLLGHGFVLAANLKASCGILDVCICNDVSPVASVQVEYLLIKPLAEKCLHDLGYWPDRNWQNDTTHTRTLNMGHRGCGATFSSSMSDVQENTIESFIMAYNQGADGLELDVHVTKDLQPVIYHDLDVKTLLVTKNGCEVQRKLPVHQLTYKELQEIQIQHTPSSELNGELNGRSDLSRKIAPTLEEVLMTLPVDFPLELEVKYLETEKDHEDEPFLDVNIYVDTILKKVLQHMGERRIILMSFSPVIVQLMSKKQKKLPVKIAVCGESEKYPVYKDIRIRTVGMTVGFCLCERLLGLSCFCDNILMNPNIVNEIKQRNLVLSTWGDDNDKEEERERQRHLGVNVLCFDSIHKVLDKELKKTKEARYCK